MHIRYGYNIEIVCQQELPLITLLDVHPSRRHDLLTPGEMTVTSLLDPSRQIATTQHIDPFGNICRRITAPAGGIALRAEGIILDSGELDPVTPPFWGEAITKHLSNAKHVVIPGTGHTRTFQTRAR